MLNILPTWSWALAAIVWVTLYLKSLIYENNKTSLTGLSDAFCFSIGIPYGFGLLLEGFRINPILFLAQSILVSLFSLIIYEAIRVRTRMEKENNEVKHRDREDNQRNRFGTKFLKRTRLR